MDRFFNWLASWGEKDKWIHLSICLVIALLGGCLVKICGGDRVVAMGGAWLFGFAAGVIKELYDEMKAGSSDSADWAADIIGTTVGALAVLILV